MIHVTGDMYISADGNGYSVIQRRVSGVDSKEPGKEYFTPMNIYCSTLEATCRAILKQAQRRYVMDNDVELREAAEAFRRLESSKRDWLKLLQDLVSD